jgi:cell division septation protein DedD
MPACPACACASPAGDAAHRIVDALREDDLDRAIELGLLEDVACEACAPECRDALTQARDARRSALAARERYRDRALRLARLQREREAKRAPVQAQTGAPALPPAAAAALERAKARAAQRKPE